VSPASRAPCRCGPWARVSPRPTRSDGNSANGLEQKVDSNQNGEVDGGEGTDSADNDGARQAQTAQSETGKVLRLR
jgi:hypothetical protein